MVMLSTAATPNNLETHENLPSGALVTNAPHHVTQLTGNCITCKDSIELDLNDIVYIEDQNPFDLGFDTADYLPEDFDPFEVYVDLNAIDYIEEDQNIEIGFDTASWLPADYNPYAAPEDITSISYMETEEDVYANIDTAAWLPDGFDPYESVSGPIAICGVTYTVNPK